MRLRDWLIIAATLVLIGTAYGYAQHQDAETACRDAQVPP